MAINLTTKQWLLSIEKIYDPKQKFKGKDLRLVGLWASGKAKHFPST